MEDSAIIDLYFFRSEKAIEETDKKYRPYCEYIGMNILRDHQDTEECINDSYLHTWNSIPPTQPKSLKSFLGRIMRNLSLDRFRNKHAKKRNSGETEVLLSELNDCIPDNNSVWDKIEFRLLGEAIDKFLSGVTEKNRVIFIKRYYFCENIGDIARECGLSSSNVKVTLFRMRGLLKEHLQKEGYNI